MSAIGDFIGGFAGRAIQDLDRKALAQEEERKRLAEMNDWEKKQLFLQKLEETAAKKRPTGQRFENGQVVYTNAYGEQVFARQATADEMKAQTAAGRKLDAEIAANDPARIEEDRQREIRKDNADISYRGALSAQAGASARESDARTKFTDAQRQAFEQTGTLPGRGGALGAGSNPFLRADKLSDSYREMLADPSVSPQIKQEIADAQAAIATAAAAGDTELVAQLEALLAQSLAELSGQ